MPMTPEEARTAMDAMEPVDLDFIVHCRRDAVKEVTAVLPPSVTVEPVSVETIDGDPDHVRLRTGLLHRRLTREEQDHLQHHLSQLGRAGKLVQWGTRMTRGDLPPSAFPFGRGQVPDLAALLPGTIRVGTWARLPRRTSLDEPLRD